MAAWKSIECIIGAAVILTPGTGSSLRLVMLNLIVSPTRARIVGPGTVSPKVQALNFTPGAISITLCVVSSCTFFTGAGSRGLSTAPKLSESPWAKAPVLRRSLTLAGGDLRIIEAGSYRSRTGAGACAWAPAAASAMKTAVASTPLLGGVKRFPLDGAHRSAPQPDRAYAIAARLCAHEHDGGARSNRRSGRPARIVGLHAAALPSHCLRLRGREPRGSRRADGLHDHRQLGRREGNAAQAPAAGPVPVRRAAGEGARRLAREGVHAAGPVRRARRLRPLQRGRHVLLGQCGVRRAPRHRPARARVVQRLVPGALREPEGGVPLRLREPQPRRVPLLLLARG